MSARAWVLFLCFSTLVASAASAVPPVAVPEPSRPDQTSQVAHARLSWDAEQQICRLLWLAGP